MARFAFGGRTSAVCTAARGPSVYATAAVRPKILEIGIFNTTATEVCIGICRATATGTKGAAITPVCASDDSHVALSTGANTHTVDATVGVPLRQATLGAAKGAGVIFTFADFELTNATTAGCVITCPTGTGQHLDFYYLFEE